MLIGALHTTDLFWAVFSTLGAIYPLYKLIPAHREPGAKELIGLIVVLAAYPWATATFHLTPFDNGLVLAVCLFGVPAYLSLILRAVNMYSRTLTMVHIATYTVATAMSLFALTNVWHGLFATFDPHVPGQANHAISHGGTGIGMTLTYLFEFSAVGATLIITGFNYSRARWNRVHIVSAFILPGAALGASLMLTAALLETLQINPFFVATAGALWCLTYSFSRKTTNAVIRVSHSEVIMHMPDAIAIVDQDNTIVDFNPAFTTLFGCGEEDISGHALASYLPDDALAADTTLTKQSDSGEQHLEIKVKQLRGYDSRQDRLLLIRDVTEGTNAMHELQSSQNQLNLANTELLRISNTDQLTGLNNRRFFDACFEDALTAVNHEQTVGLLLVDIDHFKRINDTLGHQTGDRVLVELAQAMQAQCREGDILARIGGEEFALILPNVDRESLSAIANRFHKDIQIYVADVGVITTSMGAILALPEESGSSVINRADEALYQAKNDGRNRVVVSHAQPRAVAVSA